jgi:predicted nucleotidyltransferase
MIQLEPIILLLKQKIDDLQGIYLFGSQASGRSRPDSDIDLAVLAKTVINPVRRWEIAAECGIAVQRDIDLVDLRTATTVLQYQVITEGQRIYTIDEYSCDAFENCIMSEYLDFQMFRQPLIDAIRKRGSIYDR